jgi:hypothetical protein
MHYHDVPTVRAPNIPSFVERCKSIFAQRRFALDGAAGSDEHGPTKVPFAAVWGAMLLS